jgi:hypothetical protein
MRQTRESFDGKSQKYDDDDDDDEITLLLSILLCPAIFFHTKMARNISSLQQCKKTKRQLGDNSYRKFLDDMREAWL